MKVFCVHYLFLRDGRLIEMPPRTVEDLTKAGVMITMGGKPEGKLIQMNWEPEPDGITWLGDTELIDTVKAVAHVINGIPDRENKSCKFYQEKKKESDS